MTLQAVFLDTLSRISANRVGTFSHISLLGFTFIIRSGRTIWLFGPWTMSLLKPERGNRVCCGGGVVCVLLEWATDCLPCLDSSDSGCLFSRADGTWSREPRVLQPEREWELLCVVRGSEANNTHSLTLLTSSCSFSWERGSKPISQHAVGRRQRNMVPLGGGCVYNVHIEGPFEWSLMWEIYLCPSGICFYYLKMHFVF